VVGVIILVDMVVEVDEDLVDVDDVYDLDDFGDVVDVVDVVDDVALRNCANSNSTVDGVEMSFLFQASFCFNQTSLKYLLLKAVEVDGDDNFNVEKDDADVDFDFDFEDSSGCSGFIDINFDNAVDAVVNVVVVCCC
jgi:hypothetical protein